MFSWLKKVLENVKDLSSSIDTYKKDTIIQSLPTLTFVNRAKKLIDANKFEEAEKILLEALELPQEDPLVFKYLGAVYEKINRHDLAVENYQKSADLNPNDKIIWQRLGFSLISIKKYEQAEKSFENSNTIMPNDTETYTGWGMALMKQEKFAESREKFMQALKIQKTNFIALFLCSIAEIKLKMYEPAEDKLRFLVKVSPNANNMFEYARLRALKKDYDAAILYAKKSIDCYSLMFPAHILLGQIYSIKNDFENSFMYFQLAEDKGMNDAELYFHWGETFYGFGKYDEAIEKLLKSIEFEKQEDNISYLILCYALNKEFEKAKHLLEENQNLDNSTIQTASGILKYEEGDINSAISILRSDEEDTVNCLYLAKCYQKLNNNTKTRDYYEALLRLDSKSINAYIDYANYLISINDYKEAQRKLRKAIKLDEDNLTILNLLFHVSYILVKDNICEYNVKETIAIAEKIESINPLEYPEQKAELIQLLQDMKEK